MPLQAPARGRCPKTGENMAKVKAPARKPASRIPADGWAPLADPCPIGVKIAWAFRSPHGSKPSYFMQLRDRKSVV